MTNNSNNTSGTKPNRHFHLDRQDAFITAGAGQLKISTIPKEVPIFTYSIGHQRTDHETGKTFFAPYVRHADLPAVIAALQAEYDRNQAGLIEAKAKVQREFDEGQKEASSWKGDKGSKDLRRLHKVGVRAAQGKDAVKPKVDSAREREKNLQTFQASLNKGEGEVGQP